MLKWTPRRKDVLMEWM